MVFISSRGQSLYSVSLIVPLFSNKINVKWLLMTIARETLTLLEYSENNLSPPGGGGGGGDGGLNSYYCKYI